MRILILILGFKGLKGELQAKVKSVIWIMNRIEIVCVRLEMSLAFLHIVIHYM